MRAIHCWACLLALASLTPLRAQVVDDFAQGGWKLFDSTPGRITAQAGALSL